MKIKKITKEKSDVVRTIKSNSKSKDSHVDIYDIDDVYVFIIQHNPDNETTPYYASVSRNDEKPVSNIMIKKIIFSKLINQEYKNMGVTILRPTGSYVTHIYPTKGRSK